eukprot:747559-Hanusia_phi.AAC.1
MPTSSALTLPACPTSSEETSTRCSLPSPLPLPPLLQLSDQSQAVVEELLCLIAKKRLLSYAKLSSVAAATGIVLAQVLPGLLLLLLLRSVTPSPSAFFPSPRCHSVLPLVP